MSVADALRTYRSRFAHAAWGQGSAQSWRAAVLRRLSRPVVVVLTGAVAAATVLLLVTSLLSAVVQSWSRADIQMRARIVHLTTKDQIEALLRDGSLTAKVQLEGLFKRLISDERLEAVGICEPNGAMLGATQTMPARLSCSSLRLGKKESTTEIGLGDQDLLVSAFPLKEGAGHLIIVHDLTYSRARSEEARIYILIATVAAAALVGGAAAFAAFVLFRNWDAALRHAIDDLRAGRVDTPHPPASLPAQLRQALDQYDLVRRTIDGVHIDWSPETLKRALGAELPGVEIIVVANREPYIHNFVDGKIAVQIPASGLVSALEPVIRSCGGTWIGHGSGGSADRETVDSHDRIAVPPGAPAYTLRRIWLSDDEQDGYYYGLANEGIWPLCHIAFVRPIFRESDWAQYKAVNAKFADAVVREARSSAPVVLIQDYHFALLPRLVRDRLPNATIITFWHIPWPNAETFGICPWKEEIIDGLLGSSILGFHTDFHCNNFLETVDRFVESRIDRERRSVTLGGAETMVRAYPISIEWPPSALESQAPTPVCRAAVRKRFGLSDKTRIGVGIERFDYTRGILDRMRAVDALMVRYPEWKERFTFIQAAAPTRSNIASYRSLQEEAVSLAEEINNRYAANGWRPIILSVRHYEPPEVFELFRSADLCVVSSLHDGMNLVAKEFASARDDERGVLVLSTFAGASRELAEALIVNPYHAHDMAEAMHRALTMPAAEQEARMRQMRALVRTRNVYRWAGQMLLDAAQLRRRDEIEALAQSNAPAALATIRGTAA